MYFSELNAMKFIIHILKIKVKQDFRLNVSYVDKVYDVLNSINLEEVIGC